VPIVEDLTPYPKGCLWAEPSIEQATSAMRAVFERPEESKQLGLRAKAHTSEVLAIRSAGERMAARLREIAALKSTQGRE